MTARVVRADYDQLKAAAGDFDQQADEVRQMLARLKHQGEVLQGGDWLGTGAQAFYAEMNGQVVPTLSRLLQALSQAAATTRQISQSMQQTEAEAAAFFHLNGNGAVKGGSLGSVGAAVGAALGSLGNAGAALGAITPGNGAGAAAGDGAVVGEGMKAFVAGPKAKAPKPAPHAGVDFMGGESNPIPDPTGVRPYDRVPDGESGFKVGGLGSRNVAMWAQRFKQVGPMIEAQRQALAKMKDQFNAMMKKEQGEVVAATKNMRANLEKLNAKTNGAVYSLIHKYSEQGRAAKTADMRAQGAEKRVNQALQEHKSAQAKLAAFEKTAARQTIAEEKAALEARVAERKAAISKIVGAAASATGGAGGMFGKAAEMGSELVTEVIGGMSASELRQMARMDAQIAALDEAIAKEQDTAVRADLQAAKIKIEASFDDFAAAKMEARSAEIAQMGTIDELAALEKAHNTGRVFRELQDYNAKAHQLGNQVRAGSEDYMNALERTPGIGDAARISQQVAEDRRHVQIYGRNDADWQEQARGTEGYLDNVERWRQGEIASHGTLRDAIVEGKHVDFTDAIMQSADEALGGTAVKGQTVRQ